MNSMPYGECVTHLALAPKPAVPAGAAFANYSCRATEWTTSTAELERDRNAAKDVLAAQELDRYTADSRE